MLVVKLNSLVTKGNLMAEKLQGFLDDEASLQPVKREDSFDADFYSTKIPAAQKALFEKEADFRKSLSTLDNITATIPAVFANIVDTFGTSLGILDDESVQAFLEENAPTVAAFSQEHEGAVSVAGDILGSFIPAGVAIKAVRAGGILAKVAEKTLGKGAAKYVISTGKTNQQLAEEFITKSKVAETVNKGVRRLDQTSTEFIKARKAMIGRSMGDVLIEGIAADAAIAATMNSSDFLFPPEMSIAENLAFFGVANVAFTSAAGAIAKMSINRNAQNIFGKLAEKAQNPGGVKTKDIISQPELRGLAISSLATKMADKLDERAAAVQVQDSELLTAIDTELSAIDAEMSTIFQAAAKDSPDKGMTFAYNLSDKSGELRTLLGQARLDPQTFEGLRTIEAFAPGIGSTQETAKQALLLRKRDAFKKKLRQIEAEQNKANPDEGKLKQLRAEAELDARAGIRLRKTQPFIVEIDGGISDAVSRKEIFQDGERKITTIARDELRVQDKERGFSAVIGKDGSVRFQSSKIKAPEFDNKLKFIRAGGSTNFVRLNRQEGKITKTRAGQYRVHLKDVEAEGDFEVLGTFDKLKTAKEEAGKALQKRNDLDLETIDSKHRLQGEQLSDLDLFETTAIWDGLQKRLEDIDPKTMGLFRVGVATHHTKLDFIRELFNVVDPELMAGKVKGRVESVDDIEFMSLASKAREYQKIVQENARAHTAGELEKILSPQDIARKLNLPTDDKHPIYQMLGELAIEKGQTLLESFYKNMGEVRAGLAKIAGVPPEEMATSPLELTGNMLRMDRTKKPVSVLMENVEDASVSDYRTRITEKAIAERANVAAKLRTEDSVLVQSMMKIVDENQPIVSGFKEAISKIIGGLEPTGRLVSGFVQNNFRLRGVPGFAEADALAANSTRVTTKVVEKLFDNFDDVLRLGKDSEGNLLTPKNAFSTLFNRGNRADQISFFSLRTMLSRGWDILPEPAATAEGFALRLDPKSARNRKLWAEVTGNDDFLLGIQQFSKHLPNVDGRGSLMITGKAWDAARSFNGLSQQYLKEVNAINIAKGERPIKGKAFHMPPVNFEGQSIAYLLDNAGKVKAAVGGATQQQAEKLAREQAAAWDIPVHVVGETSVANYRKARAQAFFDMENFTKTPKQTGPAKGTSGGSVVQFGSDLLKGMTEQIVRGFDDIRLESLNTIFEGELRFLRLQEQAGNFAKDQTNVYRSIRATLLGIKDVNKEGPIAKTLGAVEQSYDLILKALHDNLPGKPGIFVAKEQQRDFENLKKELGDFSPFTTLNDFITRTENVKLPSQMVKHSALMNNIVTATTIRVFDIGMGLVNMLTLPSTIVPVAKALRRFEGETNEAHIARIGAWGTTSPEGVAQFSASRALSSGIDFMFREREFMKRAGDLGYLDQFAAEQAELFSRTGESFFKGQLRNAVNITSKVTDTTEVMARAVAFATFAKAGRDLLGLKTDDAIMMFANKQANNVIADFRPSNRPAVFQGAAGMPLGLFTTFMWNYLQRLYSIVENKAVSAAVAQVGIQASLFGVESLPGAQSFIEHFTSNYDGSVNIVDRLNERLGQDATSVLMNGTLANLGTITGSDYVPNVSIGPRAAIGLPLQTFGLDAVPAFRLATRAMETTGRMIDSVSANEGFDITQMSQILAKSNLNKGVSNIIEIANNKAVDLNDNIIEGEVRTTAGIGARVLGFKPLYADELRQENRRNRTIERKRTAIRDRLGESLRSSIRSGNLTSEDVDRALVDYMKAGGNAENFKRYFRSQLIKGTQTKRDLEIAKAIRRNADEGRMARLLFLQEDE